MNFNAHYIVGKNDYLYQKLDFDLNIRLKMECSTI